MRNAIKLYARAIIFLLLIAAPIHHAIAKELLAPEGEWMAPGDGHKSVMIFSPVRNEQFTAFGNSCEVLEHTDVFLLGKREKDNFVALMKISNDALIYFDNITSGMLLIRRGFEKETSAPSGRWISANFMHKERVIIDFTKKEYAYGTESYVAFHTALSPFDKEFTGLTLLLDEEDNELFECVKMNEGLLGCRFPQDEYGGPNNEFTPYIPAPGRP